MEQLLKLDRNIILKYYNKMVSSYSKLYFNKLAVPFPENFKLNGLHRFKESKTLSLNFRRFTESAGRQPKWLQINWLLGDQLPISCRSGYLQKTMFFTSFEVFSLYSQQGPQTSSDEFPKLMKITTISVDDKQLIVSNLSL